MPVDRPCSCAHSPISTTLTVRDESTGGATLRQFDIELPTERITVRELIRSRVYQEVKDYNARQPAEFQGLVQPTDAERTLNGFRLPNKRQIDWKEQYEKAIEAFQSGRIVILLADRQLDALETEIEIGPDTEVSFLRLTPSFREAVQPEVFDGIGNARNLLRSDTPTQLMADLLHVSVKSTDARKPLRELLRPPVNYRRNAPKVWRYDHLRIGWVF